MLKDIYGACDINGDIQLRIPDRAAHIHLRGMMTYDFRTFIPEDRRNRTIADVCLIETGVRMHILAPAGGEVVDNHHVMAFFDETVDEMRPYESCAAGDENFHANFPFMIILRLPTAKMRRMERPKMSDT